MGGEPSTWMNMAHGGQQQGMYGMPNVWMNMARGGGGSPGMYGMPTAWLNMARQQVGAGQNPTPPVQQTPGITSLPGAYQWQQTAYNDPYMPQQNFGYFNK